MTPRVSIIVPVYNEEKTIGSVMELLLQKQRCWTLASEIIVVQSLGTDNTDKVLFDYIGYVKLVTQAKPMGKGHAVREGLKHARGEIIIIQDADLEYSIGDYNRLVFPILNGHDFVLGSRHMTTAPMRRFKDARLMELWLNFGHKLFAFALNKLLGTDLKDPFTMFKVFRRQCIDGLEFECDRFDFDIELLMKIVQRGFRPIEIPVTYRSRSFQDGKKIRIWKDPWTWIRTMLRVWRSK